MSETIINRSGVNTNPATDGAVLAVVDAINAMNLGGIEVVIDAGTKAVGDTSGGATVQLSNISIPCKFVVVAAPSAKESTGVNANPIYVAVSNDSSISHANTLLQGRYLGVSNYEGIRIYTDNADKIYLAGFTAGDDVRYQVIN